MRIEAVEIRQVALPMVEPLVSAHGALSDRHLVLVDVRTDEGDAWGECVALNDPTYNSEWSGGAYEVLRSVFLPSLLSLPSVSAGAAAATLAAFEGHFAAKAAIEMALLDLELKRIGVPLTAALGGGADRVEACAVLGLADEATTLHRARVRAAEGFGHFKVKIVPGNDLDRVRAVRSAHPDVQISIDANGSFDWSDHSHQRTLMALDELGLRAFEQPFSVSDRWSIRASRERLTTPIALDESITSPAEGAMLVNEGLCDAVVIKPGNLGGALQAMTLAATAREHNKQAWLGGMVEAGLSRAVSLAVAAQAPFAGQAHEVSADRRWFRDSIINETVTMTDGSIEVPIEPGLGVSVNVDLVERFTLRYEVLR